MSKTATTTVAEVEVPPVVAGWEQTTVNRGFAEWWRKGSEADTAQYERLVISEGRGEGEWTLEHTATNQFGVRVHTFALKPIPADDFRSAIDAAVERMRTHPTRRTLDAVPDMPRRVGEWQLIEAASARWVWRCSEEKVYVERARASNEVNRRLFNAWHDGGWETATIHTETPLLPCLRGAMRCMRAYPSGGIGGGNAYDQLRDIAGVGRVRARQLQALGVTGKHHLHALLANEDSIDQRFRRRLETVVTAEIRNAASGSGTVPAKE